MPEPTVSVLILTYNRPHLIGRAIESVIRQDYQEWELLVVHDGPDERTIDTMRKWQQRETRIRYLHRKEPGNIAEATNYGISQARGKYIAILDDDDYWAAPDKLARQVKFLEESPEYVACGGGAIVIDRNSVETMRYLKPENDQAIKSRALLANPMVHSTLLYRRAVALDLEGYNETLPGFQDWDLYSSWGRPASSIISRCSSHTILSGMPGVPFSSRLRTPGPALELYGSTSAGTRMRLWLSVWCGSTTPTPICRFSPENIRTTFWPA